MSYFKDIINKNVAWFLQSDYVIPISGLKYTKNKNYAAATMILTQNCFQ